MVISGPADVEVAVVVAAVATVVAVVVAVVVAAASDECTGKGQGEGQDHIKRAADNVETMHPQYLLACVGRIRPKPILERPHSIQLDPTVAWRFYWKV